MSKRIVGKEPKVLMDTTNLKLRVFHGTVRQLFHHAERILLQWVAEGLISPYKDSRQGGRRVYDLKNIIEFGIIEFLQDNGISLKGVKSILRREDVQERLKKQQFNFYILAARSHYNYLPEERHTNRVPDPYIFRCEVAYTKEEMHETLDSMHSSFPYVGTLDVLDMFFSLLRIMKENKVDDVMEWHI